MEKGLRKVVSLCPFDGCMYFPRAGSRISLSLCGVGFSNHHGAEDVHSSCTRRGVLIVPATCSKYINRFVVDPAHG